MNEGLTAEALELWRGNRRLLAGVSFSAAPGSIVHITGRNGVGKTTLLRVMCGLTRPESGQVLWRGRRIEADAGAFHSELAWLGHREGLRPELTARENLELARRLQGREAGNAAADLEKAGIGHLVDLAVRAFSAGQKRRVALLRVFSSGASLWLLDEPFANLDADGRDWGLARVREHTAAGGVCILSTHLDLDGDDVVKVNLSS
ncbi:MAG: cytochrome c biogenesis heme-transporting ATPase CcmA [Gammaproteobacteria bacterium]|nr:cytochrome c biogenesis heme-transporting ATPase CcmA [Gammaproteobacteria bacterium]